MEASRHASVELTCNYGVDGRILIVVVFFILDREVDSVAMEDERRRFVGSGPVLSTFG